MKKSIITRIAAALLCASILSSCTARIDGAPSGMKLISTDDVDYYLYVPESWVEDISTGVVTAYVGETDRSNISLAAFDLEDPNIAPSQFWESYKQDIITTFPDVVFLEESNAVVDGVYAAPQYTFTATVTGAEYEFMETLFVHGGAVYILTYTAEAEIFESHLEDVQDIVSNIKFR